MIRKYLYFFLCTSLAAPSAALAERQKVDIPDYMQNEIRLERKAEFERGSVLYLKKSQDALYKGKQVNSRTAQRQGHGLVLPDGEGGIIIVPGIEAPAQNPQLVDARELKLKMRELASQLVGGLNPSLSSYIALPTAFVQQDDFNRSSSLGRFAVEQLYYEFNQRGLRTKEYRMDKNLTVREDGEYILARTPGSSPLNSNTLYIVGTYYTAGEVLFINARLIRSNGDILRTGQLIFELSPLSKRMLANSGLKMPEASLEIKDFQTEARPPETVTAFEQGLDIH